MSISSRVKVGTPAGGFRPRTSVGMKWGGESRVRKESPSRLRLVRPGPVRPRPEPEMRPVFEAVPDLVAPPLTFLSKRNFCVLAGLALVVILLVWGMVRANHQAVVYSYEISDLTEEKLRLLDTNRRLHSELAEAGSLPRLELAARERLNLISPKQGQIVVID